MSGNTSREVAETETQTTGEKSTAIIITLLVVFSVGFVVMAGFSIVLWTLVAFAQDNPSGGGDCLLREAGNGFSGNPDFYGFGIRLGIYFQWWASLIANVFKLEDRGSVYAGYLVFSIALIVALLMLTFQHTCTFTAEIIVILFIHWGGFIGLLYSSDAASTRYDRVSRLGVGKSYTMVGPLWIGTAFSTWFWLRLATAGEVDFEPTPGGTSYFVFSRVSTDTKAASRFIVFLCFFFGWILVSQLFGYLAGFLWGSVRLLRSILLHNDEESGVDTPVTENADEEGEEQRTKNAKRFLGIFSVLVLIYSTTAIEMTLVWNSVLGVYTVASTGQVIPLIAGLGLFINALWKLEPWNRFMPTQSKDRAEVEQEDNKYDVNKPKDVVSAQVLFQQDDGTWQ